MATNLEKSIKSALGTLYRGTRERHFSSRSIDVRLINGVPFTSSNFKITEVSATQVDISFDVNGVVSCGLADGPMDLDPPEALIVDHHVNGTYNARINIRRSTSGLLRHRVKGKAELQISRTVVRKDFAYKQPFKKNSKTAAMTPSKLLNIIIRQKLNIDHQ